MSYSARVIADGASYYWRLNEPSGPTALDSIGGLNGTISGGVTLGAPGPLSDGSKAMTFNGTTGKIQTTLAVTIPLAVTIELWVRSVSLVAQTMASNWPPDAAGGVSLGTVNGSHGFLMTRNLPPSGLSGFYANLTDGAWHHLVGVLDGTFAALYADGVLDASSQSFPHTGIALPLTLAGLTDGQERLTGSLAEVAIYPRVLTAPEVAAHYAARLDDALSMIGLPDEALMRGYTHGFAITPHDTNAVPKPAQALWVGGAGNISVVLANETIATVLTGVPAGSLLPISPKIVKAAGTTATLMIGLSE